MFALFYYLQYLLLLYSTFSCFIINRQISYAQYQYTSNFDYRRRPSHLIINNIKKLRPFKPAHIVTEAFDRQIKQPSRTMNISRLGRSRDQLQNTKGQTYVRSRLFSSYVRNEMNHAIPEAISPFLQNFNNDEKEEKPVSVKPKLRSTTTTTTTITPLTVQPILLSRISPGADEAKRARMQARWRKLGLLVKSVQYPYNRRNWQRIILTKSGGNSLHFSNRMQKIKQQLLQQQQQQEAKRVIPEKVEKRPRVGGILLSNAKIKSKLFNNEVDEWPREIVKPTTTTLSTTVTVTTTVPVTDLHTEVTQKSAIIGTTFTTTTTPTTMTTTTTTSATISSTSSLFPSPVLTSRSFDFGNATTIEPKSFPFSTSSNDYHFRQITPAKKFKFAQKFRRQPRLKIRKPGEKGLLRGNQTASIRNPIILPQLEPLNLENEIEQTKLDNDANGFGNGKFPIDEFGLMEFGNGKPPPVDFSQATINVFGSNDQKQSANDQNGLSVDVETTEMKTTEKIASTDSPIEISTMVSSTQSVEHFGTTSSVNSQPELKNSGLLPALPPSDFDGEFGTGKGVALLGGSPHEAQKGFDNEIKESIFTGDSALTPNRIGPTGDGLGPPIPSGAAIPPPVPAVGIGGAAAGILPTLSDRYLKTQNPPTTIKPSALLNFLSKADIGFNQAINHFEQGTPIESAAIDILEVALGSEKLDSQAKLLGHIDRTIGIDNLQRLQRWVNTGGALDALKEQLLKFAKNYSIPEDLLPTVPPQLQYLFAPGRKR